MNTNQWLVRTSFFLGFGIALLLRFHVWLFKKRITFLKVKTMSILLIGGLGIYWHLDTVCIRIQWWIDTTWLRMQWWMAVDNLHWQLQWKSFFSYWDGFFTGAGWGLLLGIAIMIMMRRQKT